MRLALLLLIAATTYGCITKTTPVSTVAFAGKTVSVSDSLLQTVGGICDTLDIGHLKSGEMVSSSLQLSNNGTKPFVILGIESSCGCTTADHPTQPIKEGDSAMISFEFDSKGFYGWQLKLMKLRTSLASEPIKIYITADVE